MVNQYKVMGDAFVPHGDLEPVVPTIRPGVYQVGAGMAGIYLAPTTLTSDGLLLLEDSPAARVVKDVRDFWQRRDKFKQLDLTHKRGILLYGPPGTGKTSVISLVANEFTRDGGVTILMSAYDIGKAVAGARLIREVEPERPILMVLEDVEHAADDSDLLAFLDGQSSVDGVVVLATTNYKEKLPPRLTQRPSRFDRLVEIGNPPREVRLGYLLGRLQGVITGAEMESWADATEGLAIAHLRELIVAVLCLGNPFDETLERLKTMSTVDLDPPEDDEEY